MSETERHDVDYYSRGEAIRTEILGMIHAAASPFDILMKVAKYLEETTHEVGYADKVRDNLRTVYGILLEDKKLLADELAEVRERLSRIEGALSDPKFTEEEKKRIEYAVILHRKRIKRLEEMIKHAEVYRTEPFIEKY